MIKAPKKHASTHSNAASMRRIGQVIVFEICEGAISVLALELWRSVKYTLSLLGISERVAAPLTVIILVNLIYAFALLVEVLVEALGSRALVEPVYGFMLLVTVFSFLAIMIGIFFAVKLAASESFDYFW